MRSFFSFLTAAMVLATCVTGLAQTRHLNVGSTPSPEEIKAMDGLVGPSGKGLPPGSGTATDGAKIYAQKCAFCHGKNGEGSRGIGGSGGGPRLVGGKGSLATPEPVRTVGSSYPFATTLWTYINRSMPENRPGSLTADEVYALSAFLLFRNEIIQESDVLDAKTLPKIQMPNRNGFHPAVPAWPESEETKRVSGEYVTPRRR
jgi:S-disulfanyl-L-cysteine oxidoreductase SoxD